MKKRQVKKRIQGGGKRVLGMLLAASMLVQPCEGFATAKTVPEDNVPVYEYLQSDRIAKEELPEGDLIYFGTASAILPEKGSYAVKLYREGNLDKKASVGLHTIDMTAVYGEDYELAMDDVKVTGDGKSLLEKYTKGNEIISPDELSELAMSSETEEAALKKFEETAAEDMLNTGTDDSIDSTEVSSLARKKEEQTGMKTRKLSQEQEEEQGIMDAVMGEMAADAMSELESSSQSTITFKKGESEKTVKFNILEDDKSEGMEGFSLLLTDPQGAELYQVTSLAVSIKDDEETVRSKVSFSQGEYKADNGKAVLKIKRTGADYSICDMVLRTSGGTAEAGINYIEKNELVAFAPYEMEKEIEIDVYGSGIFNVFLSEFSACEEGKYTKASIEITGDDTAEDSKNKLRNAAKSASGTKSFDIEIKGTKYSVEYVFGEPTGKIMDESYDPPVEAGTYYFAADKAHGGIFEYGYMGGDKPSLGGCRNTDYRYYNKSGKDEWEFDTSKNKKGDYGRLDYYSPWTGHKGWAGTMAYNIPGVYYSYLIPDWFTDNGTDYGRREVTVSGTDKATNTTTKNTVNTRGHYKRNQDDGAVVNKYDSNISVYVGVYTDGQLRKSFTRFFGLCAMNRKFNISMQPTDTLKFRSGEAGSVTETAGLQVEVECGAQPKNGNTQSRDIYACQDGSIDNLVFSVKDVEVNGHTGKFAYIDGYVITVDPGKTTNKNVTLNYPADIISWLNEKVKKPEKESSISFSRKSVDAQIDKIKSNLSQVPYDAYFLQWINEKQKDVADDNTGYGYKQNLKFKPIIKYYDVTVEVESPSGDGEGTFKDKQLSENGNYTFHLGDKINLAVNVNDPEHYEVVGYQVCTNKANMYNTITDTQELFLGELPESGVYKIRPVIRKKSNVIEVNFPNSSDSSRFSIPGLVSQTELNKLGKEYNSLKGKNILIANPEGKTTLEKIIAVPGKQYIVRVMLNDSASEGDTIYRPNIKKKTSNTTYSTQVFQFTAGTDPTDNVIEVRSSSTAKSSLQKYTIEGNLVSSFKPIKADGQALKNLPLTGYSVSAGNNEQKKDKNGKVYADVSASISDTTGKFILEGITGVTGDIIPVIISNGISSAQIVNVKLSNGIRTPDGSYKVYAENTKFTYPHDAPKVTSLKYSYDKEEYLQKNGGTSPVAVHIFDDMFTLDAKVDTCGRDIQKAIFTVTTDDGKESTYEAAEAENNPGHFIVKLPMADSIFPGSKIKVRLVDNEKLYSAAGKDENGKNIIGDDGEVITGIKSQIEYPDVDTGLSFFTEQVLVNPQYYDVTDDEAVANIPLIGKATAGATSGKLIFDKVKWTDGNGYTLQVGVNMGFGNQTVPSDEDKLKSLKSFMNAVNSDKANAEEIALGKEPGSTQPGKTDLKKEKAEMSSVVEKQKSSTSGKAKQAIAAMNKKEPTWKVSTSLMLAFDFVKTPENSEYKGDCLFTSGGVAIGGTFTFNKTFYTMIASVPAFMNLSSTLQGDLVVAYKTQKGGEVLTASAFNGFSGNLAERLESPKAQLSLMLSGKIQVGVGLLGVLSARGYVTLRWQADLGLNEDTQSGSLVGSSGGIGFDLLIFSIDIDLYNVTTGWGTLEGQTKYSFFGGLLEAGKSSKGSARKASLLNSGSDKVIKKYSKNEVMTEHQYYTGTSDMSGFGKGNGLKRATPGVVKINPILEDAAERTRPKIIPLNDDNTKKMLIFMGNNGTAGNEVATDRLNNHALFYSVDNGDGNGWSEPQPVDGDGTLDSTPDIIRGKNVDGKEKVIIAWADADRAFTGQDNTKSKLSAMGISAVVYDVETGEMGEKISLIGDDEYFNLSPKLNYNNGIIYCSYMKRDIASLNDDSELTDFTRSYSTMAYVAYDTVNREYITRSEDGSRIAVKDISAEVTGTAISTVMETDASTDIVTESSVYGEAAIAEADVTKTSYEQYINIYHETLDDPLVTDYQSVITELDSDVYMLSAYTVDEDANLSTKEDRKLFLGIYNITQDREYYPIKVADDSTSQSAPALSDIDGVVYLTWLEDGYIFHMSDVSQLLETLFVDEGEIVIKNDTVDGESTEVKFTINKDLYKNSYIGSNNESYNWYKKTMEELGLEDEEIYENSLYSALAENSLPSDYASFSQRDDMQTSISNYTVTSDGKDIYVFFTDFGTKDENSTGIEIYGVRYKTGGSSAASATDESGETGVTMEDSCGFEQAVQITNGNMVIDELSLYMDKNRRISAVSNYFAQYIGAD
ncbi:MAG: hypothetical protein K2K35_05940, partial [Lachnospiraceae bacterium]|nr:hypothetical protein [Lachnospiraceae bacterium]